MTKSINTIYRIIFGIYLSIPLCYLLVSTFSYFSVLDTFGRVPYNDTLYKLARENNLPINIFPIRYGDVLLSATFWVYISFPLMILANYLVHRANPETIFFKKQAIALFCVCLISYLLLQTDPFGGWYLSFILD